jgi:hypothetical protein
VNSGQNGALALTNIADSFTPQPETIGIYPFLANVGTNLTTPTAQAGLVTFIASVYQNLFARATDTTGAAYWLGQITSGAVGLGAAVLAIANGATGSDAIELQNKITVALDFTTRTSALGLGVSGTSGTAAFLTAAHNVLNGVDGASLNDFSVTAGELSTTLYIVTASIAGLPSSQAAQPLASANSPIVVSTSNSTINPGAGSYTIQFIGGTSADTLVLHADSVDQVSGFDPATDVLDLRSLLSEANVNLNGDVAALSNYLSITDQGGNAFVNFNPTGQGGGGSTVAVLQGLGNVVTGLGRLLGQGAIRIE